MASKAGGRCRRCHPYKQVDAQRRSASSRQRPRLHKPPEPSPTASRARPPIPRHESPRALEPAVPASHVTLELCRATQRPRRRRPGGPDCLTCSAARLFDTHALLLPPRARDCPLLGSFIILPTRHHPHTRCPAILLPRGAHIPKPHLTPPITTLTSRLSRALAVRAHQRAVSASFDIPRRPSRRPCLHRPHSFLYS